jgi:hypothetical protein
VETTAWLLDFIMQSIFSRGITVRASTCVAVFPLLFPILLDAPSASPRKKANAADL